MPTLEDDIRSSVEAMFYTPNYCDLYIHANQIREMLGIDKMLIDMVIEEILPIIPKTKKRKLPIPMCFPRLCVNWAALTRSWWR